mmetsp:Transcript_103283/g.277433  ORF Transcript_103283/g.277433 Transcript_103283/m.277433 type:complete len:415 (+) Transcript_103283:917-2161(+)
MAPLAARRLLEGVLDAQEGGDAGGRLDDAEGGRDEQELSDVRLHGDGSDGPAQDRKVTLACQKAQALQDANPILDCLLLRFGHGPLNHLDKLLVGTSVDHLGLEHDLFHRGRKHLRRREIIKCVVHIAGEEVNHQALLTSACTTPALLRVGPGDHLGVQGGDASGGIVVPLLADACVDDVDDVVDGHRGLSDVRRQHDLAQARGGALEGLVLLLRRHEGVQGDDLEGHAKLVEAQEELGDVAPARQEDQDRAVALGHLLVKVDDELLDEVQVDLPLPPHRTRLQRLLGVVIDPVLAGPPLRSVVLGDLVVDRLDRVHRHTAAAAAVPVAALLGALLAAALASALLGRAPADGLAGVLPVPVQDVVHAAGNVDGLQGGLAVDLEEVLGEGVGIEGGTHQHELQVGHATLEEHFLV